jgi:phage host-nuclease inhibitor protein Gam
MKKKEPTPADQLKQIADDLLCEILEGDEIIKRLMTEYEAEKKRMDEAFAAKIAPIEGGRDLAVKGLTALMKQGKAEIFRDGDMVYLKHGSLIRSLSHPVAFPRSHDPIIAAMEACGFNDAVKIKKSLDKDAVEKWPDDKLARVGLTRKEAEEFSYDLKKEPTK